MRRRAEAEERAALRRRERIHRAADRRNAHAAADKVDALRALSVKARAQRAEHADRLPRLAGAERLRARALGLNRQRQRARRRIRRHQADGTAQHMAAVRHEDVDELPGLRLRRDIRRGENDAHQILRHHLAGKDARGCILHVCALLT